MNRPPATPSITALIPAAGTGTRLGDARPKQYLEVADKPMIRHAIDALLAVPRIGRVAVVLSPHDRLWDALIGAIARVEPLRVGGASRAQSVRNGVAALKLDAAAWVLVHDAARPCLRVALIEQFLDELVHDPVGGLLALPLADTLKTGDGAQRVVATLPRDNLWRAQTPQMFRADDLLRGLDAMPAATDEAQAVEALGRQPKLVMGDSANIKVTYAPDLMLAGHLLSQRSRA
jgi:2-C-methyl-D-erythritol 4-phosphate cytidylyltransferase